MTTTTCPICGNPWHSDEEPVCEDPVCQAVYWRLAEQYDALAEVERILDEAHWQAELAEAGL